MAEIASAYVSLLPSLKGFGSDAERQIGPQMTSTAKRTGGKFGKVFAYSSMGPLRALGTAALGFFAVDKVKDFFASSFDEAREAQKVGAQTAAVIKSTGGAANVSAAQVGNLASAISKKVGIDDEVIQSGQNMLLTFKNIRNEAGAGNDIFNQTTKTLVDMSAAMGTEPKQAAIQLGKALNDPIKGISALSRVGVTFTDAQKKVIEGLVKGGKTAEAQKIILRELNSEFGGSAAAQATAGDKMKVAWGNLQEQIGTALLPVLDKVQSTITTKIIPAVSTFVSQLQSGQGAGGQVAAVFKTVVSVLGTVVGVVNQNRAAFGTFLGILAGFQIIRSITVGVMAFNAALAANPIGLVVVAIAALAAGLVYAYKNSETFRNIVNGAFSAIKAVAIPVLTALKTGVGVAINFIKDHWKLLVVIIGGPIAAAALLVAKHWNTIRSKVTGAVSAVIGFVKSNWQSILATLIAGPFGLAVSLVAKHWDAIKSAVSAGVGKVVGFVRELPGKIKSALGGLGSLLYNSGRELLEGLARGMLSKLGDIASTASSIASKIKGFFPGSPVKEGPLKSWNSGGVGKRLMALVSQGIDAEGPKVTKTLVKHLEKMQDALQKQRDKFKSKLDGFRSDFASLRDSVSSSFISDLFGATATEAVTDEFGRVTQVAASAGQNFMSNLLAKRGELKGLLTAFKTLTKWGLKPSFLSQLFASGNGGLILDLAGMGKAGALDAGALFGEVTSLSNQLGTAVAKNDPVSHQIVITNRKLDKVIDKLDKLGPALAHALNQVAADAKRGKGKKGK